jgi:hypothetical protein
MIKIIVTERNREEALRDEKLVWKCPWMKKPNYTGLNVPHRYYRGFLGENYFEDWLILNKIPYTRHRKTNGPEWEQEFVIFNKKWDVKTSHNPHHKEMLILKSEAEKGIGLKKSPDFYIGCRSNGELLNEKSGEIWGYIHFDYSIKYPIKGPHNSQLNKDNYAVPFSVLYPIENILKLK